MSPFSNWDLWVVAIKDGWGMICTPIFLGLKINGVWGTFVTVNGVVRFLDHKLGK